MADISSFESRDARIDRAIQDGVDAIRKQATIVLPSQDAGLVQSYVQKIGAVCDVDRARKDTEDAIDLLTIAYNAVPQREGEVRVAISAVMNKLIALQQKSQLAMQNARQVATGITRQMQDVFPDWLDVKDGHDRAEIGTFLDKDLPKLAASVKAKALEVRGQLLAIAASYDEMLKGAAEANAKGRAALNARSADSRAVEKEVEEAGAKREQLDALVADLKAQVATFEKTARDHAQRAGTAEQRALAASAVRVGVQALARAVPAFARAAGPAGLLASAILGAPPAARGTGAGGRTRDGAGPEAGAPEVPAGAAAGRAAEAQEPAPGLRDAQLRLIDRIESYERQRRGQSAALAELAALLEGHQTEQETIQLALKGLDVSLDALGRLKEIAEEVAALSTALADPGFGEGVASLRGGAGEVGEGRAERLVASVDDVFVRQAAMWHAVAVVSDRFGKLFAEGWSKLNKLSGTYVTGDKLDAYLKEASVKLAAIVAEREAAADRRIASLQDHRDKLTRDA